MLCQICVGMLRDGRGYAWFGTLDMTYTHHTSITTLQQSAAAHCPICAPLAQILKQGIELCEGQFVPVRATLSKLMVPRYESCGHGFRLDFSLGNNKRRTFMLPGIGK